MSTYAIGDIQGCFLTLQRLLKTIGFQARSDRLWLVGDLVNRGPRSLEVLRWARELGPNISAVLGNHDLHLLARAAGATPPKRRDVLEAVLAAPDREALLEWLRRLPLLHREGEFAMIHGGLSPDWSFETAEALAREAEAALHGSNGDALLAALQQSNPQRWSDDLQGTERLQTIIKIFTRIRVCRNEGTLDLEFKGPPDQAPPGYRPWFEASKREADPVTLAFGHWASLGLRISPRFLALDSGCVWGNKLSAVRLEDRRVFQESCIDFTTS